MRKIVLGAALVLLAGPLAAQDTYVKGYYRSDGTYVQGHYRSAPNNTTLDNYSTKGNVNPYTGKQGTVDPYKAPEYKPYTPPKYTPYKAPCYYNCKK